MKRLLFFFVASCVSSVALAQSTLQAQTWPSRAVQVIVPSAPGDGGDSAARLIGQKLQ